MKKCFDAASCNYTGSEYKIELLEGAKPYRANFFPIPKIHKESLETEVKRLIKIGLLKRKYNSDWASPFFIIPKKNGKVRIISDFRKVNEKIKRKPFLISNIQSLLLKLKYFKYATLLKLNGIF